MLAASPMLAADSAVHSSLLAPAPDAGKVATVKIDRRTGRLVRVVSGPQEAHSVLISAPPARINELVEQSAQLHQIDPLLVHSVIQVESNYNSYAVSNKGAEGLMQLMPSTARMLGVSNSFDPVENIEAGVKYLKYLQSVYHDDRLALAAYNAGPKAVEKYNEVPPYAETQNYVEQVGRRYRSARQAADAKSAAKRTEQAAQQAIVAAESTEPAPEPEPILEQFKDSDGRLVLKTVPQTQ